MQPPGRELTAELPDIPPQFQQICFFVSAVSVQRKSGHDKVVGVDPLRGKHWKKAFAFFRKRSAFQQRGQPDLKMPLNALADTRRLQAFLVQRIFQTQEGLLEVFKIRRLQQIFRHMIFDGHIQILKIAVTAQDHDLYIRVSAAQPLHKLYAIHSGHSDVRKHNIGMNELQLFQHFLPIGTQRTDFIAPFLPRKTMCNAVANAFLVIRNDQTIHKNPPPPVFFSIPQTKTARQECRAGLLKYSCPFIISIVYPDLRCQSAGYAICLHFLHKGSVQVLLPADIASAPDL